MCVTGDDQCRAVQAWRTGLLDRLPGEIEHGVLACARDDHGWAILMHDVGATLVPPGDEPISLADNATFLGAMAATHAAFWGRTDFAPPALGFCALEDHYREFAPAAVQREAAPHDDIPPLILSGWQFLPALVDTDIAAIITPLLDDPRPLCDALRRYPQTVLHGDWKLGNLGLRRGQPDRVVLLDWAVVGPAPVSVDIAWYLAVNCARLPVSKEASIACYRDHLARRLGDRFNDAWWTPQLELGLLGGFLQLGWVKLLGAANGSDEATRQRERAEIAWWSERARVGARWL